ncbi:lipoprotein [Rhodovulum euryhalinum]|uniref:lipoprotein n=1 Tax=Rhodovulum euryhalinum TaxID=35805 RepID=UPI003C791154
MARPSPCAPAGCRCGWVWALEGSALGSRLTLAGACAAALMLAGCGVDGPPERPASGVTVSGTAEFGVTGGSR